VIQDDLKAIGQYLHGEHWKTALSRDLGIADRTMRAIVVGTRDLKPDLEQEIYQLAAVRQMEHLLPTLKDVAEQHGLPEVIELKVYRRNVDSIHKRTWSHTADFKIKTYLAKFLSESGINAKVVLVN
jgi:hypothetical protein